MAVHQVKAILLSGLLVLAAHSMTAQRTPEQFAQTLVGQPLYLRGFCIDNKLEFDPQGTLLNTYGPGPLTLSAIDVSSVSTQGKDLVLHGRRAALVANEKGTLERKPIYSTTILFGSLRRAPNNKFLAYQEMRLLVHPDAAGKFDTALKAILVNGLAELASSVAPYWKCYAQGYFLSDQPSMNRRRELLTASKSIVSHTRIRREVTTRASLPQRSWPQANHTLPPFAAALDVRGLSHVHFTVSEHGIPVEFRIVQAVGGVWMRRHSAPSPLITSNPRNVTEEWCQPTST